MTHVCTMDGHLIKLTAPDLTNTPLETVAKTLAGINRYGGATGCAYTVARHSRIGALAALREYGRDVARAFLFHDAHEFLVGDIKTPVAHAIGQGKIDELKDKIDHAIAIRFNVDLMSFRPMIEELDREMLVAEWFRLMPGDPADHGIHHVGKSILTEAERTAIIPSTIANDADDFMRLAKHLGVNE